MKQRACFLSCMLLSMALLWCASPAAWADDQVFISDADTVRVTDIVTGDPVADFQQGLTAGGGFDDGHHMVVDSFGQRIFVLDHDSDFQIFDIGCLVTDGLDEFQISLSEPLGIAPLPNGQLLITDEEDGDGLFRLNADLSEDIQTGTGNVFDGAEGVVYDAVHDRIYVADEDDGNIEIFDGTTLDHIASVTTFCSSDGAYWLGVDGSSNRLFVLADSRCGGGAVADSGPTSLVVSTNYGIHVYNIVDDGDDLVFDQTLFGSNGNEQDCYGTLAVSESTDRLFAIDYCSNTVDVYDTTDLTSLGSIPVDRAGDMPLMVSVGHLDITDCNNNGRDDACDIARSGGPIVYFVFETSNDTVYRLQDLNDDGDADDPGEGWAYGDINGVEGIDVDQRNGDLYTAEGSNLIYRYRDLNDDRDARDEGEKFLYADDDEAGVSPGASLENIAFDESINTVYTVYEDEDLVVWHRDKNGDGDALDDGESGEFANVGYDLEEITVDASTDDVYVGDAEEDDVFRLIDVNGDGDAMDPEDIQESVGQLGHEALDFNDNTGELFAGDEDFDQFQRLLGGVENRYGGLDCCAEALAVDPIGGDVFTGDEPGFADYGIIWKFSDLNGNGDANDDGERTLFHQFLFDENSEGETEALAVYGGVDIDANDNGIPDECEVAPPPPGGGGGDQCPNDPDKTEPGVCGCGIPDVDSDEDEVMDCEDNCPDVVNPQQEDSDDDTVGDLCDNSPNEPNADQADADGDDRGDLSDNCPDVPNIDQTDLDEDGIGDLCDNCPDVSNIDQADADEDGIGDLCDECPNDAAKADPGICGCGVADTDVDEDGIPDCIDNCPDDANADQADADGDGIGDACDSTPTPPAPAPVPPPAPQNPPQDVSPLCTFCGIGCPQMMIMSFLGLAMMGFVQRRRRF